MDRLTLLATPLAGLAYLTAAGAGLAAVLGRRLPREAQAALAPVAGAALVACGSVLLPLDLSGEVLAVGVAAVGIGVTLARWRRALDTVRAGAWPIGIAVAAIVLASVPSLERGDWRPVTLYGSTDAYHWASQARAYLDGPAPEPETEHPDRVTYERSRSLEWAVALPFGLLQVAWVSGADPSAAYGALAALVFCLLPLTTFALARGWLGWRTAPSAAAGGLVAINAALLFATHFSWQQQLAGSAFAVGAFAALFSALEREAELLDAALAALFAAAAVATYRLGFTPYLIALLGTTVVTQALLRRGEPRDLGRRLGVFAGLTIVLAAPSLVAIVRGLPDFFSSGGFSTAFKRGFPPGQLAEGLGLVPRVWSVEQSWPAALEWGWLAVASAVGAGLLVMGALALRRGRPPIAPLLVAATVLTVGGYAVLLLPWFASYLSFKILSYGTPFLVLLALAPVAYGRGRLAVAALAALAVPSAAVATAAAIADSRVARFDGALAEAAAALPGDAVVAVETDDPWDQSWALYYLRERRVSVERPSYLLTEQGERVPAAAFRSGRVTHRLIGAAALVPATAP